jgi:hypothetical protein
MYEVSLSEKSNESSSLFTRAFTTSKGTPADRDVDGRHSQHEFTKNTAKYIRWDKNQLDAVISRFFEGSRLQV